MSEKLRIFESETPLPDAALSAREPTLLGFEARYARVRSHLRLLMGGHELQGWNRKHHAGRLALDRLVADQYPFVVFHGDVGTGKTATAECVCNRVVADARVEDSVLFKLSNRVRGEGMVGQMGSHLADAFARVAQAAGKTRRSFLLIDEGDSIGAARSQEHSHHEDKVAVNTLIQGIDDLRRFGGRVVVILCTNRLAVLDPALRRRAAIAEEFRRPDDAERAQLLADDLAALALKPGELQELVGLTGPTAGQPGWTYSDFRTRLYPAALARAFPERALAFGDLRLAAAEMCPSPSMEDRP